MWVRWNDGVTFVDLYKISVQGGSTKTVLILAGAETIIGPILQQSPPVAIP